MHTADSNRDQVTGVLGALVVNLESRMMNLSVGSREPGVMMLLLPGCLESFDCHEALRRQGPVQPCCRGEARGRAQAPLACLVGLTFDDLLANLPFFLASFSENCGVIGNGTRDVFPFAQ